MHQIRRLQASDGADYRELRLEALENCPEAFGSSYAEDQGLPIQRYQNTLAEHTVIGGFGPGRLDGVVALSQPTFIKMRHKVMISGMYVREEARGTGLADQLMQAAFRHAAQSAEVITLRVATTNERAVAFYTRHGFEVFGTEPKALKLDGNHYLDEYFMSRPLNMAGNGRSTATTARAR